MNFIMGRRGEPSISLILNTPLVTDHSCQFSRLTMSSLDDCGWKTIDRSVYETAESGTTLGRLDGPVAMPAPRHQRHAEITATVTTSEVTTLWRYRNECIIIIIIIIINASVLRAPRQWHSRIWMSPCQTDYSNTISVSVLPAPRHGHWCIGM